MPPSPISPSGAQKIGCAQLNSGTPDFAPSGGSCSAIPIATSTTFRLSRSRSSTAVISLMLRGGESSVPIPSTSMRSVSADKSTCRTTRMARSIRKNVRRDKVRLRITFRNKNQTNSRRGTSRRGISVSELSSRHRRDWHQHRPIPTGRTPMSADAAIIGSSRRISPRLRHLHEVGFGNP